jgi:hypothetical protein
MPDVAVHAWLARRINAPVGFMQAAAQPLNVLSRWLSPDQALNNLPKRFLNIPTVAMDARSNSSPELPPVIAVPCTAGVQPTDKMQEKEWYERVLPTMADRIHFSTASSWTCHS